MKKIISKATKREIYTLSAIMILVLVGAGIFIVNAYGGSSPAVVGHSAGEIEGVCRSDGTGCPGFIPSGAVMAFDLASCPPGWTEYTSARDRTIIGSGSSYSRGATGGETSHTLSVAEMPSHSHSVSALYPGGDGNDYGIFGSNGYWLVGVESSNQGGSAPHNNMQPYIALLYCKKN